MGSGPWTKYGAPAMAPSGPWDKYASGDGPWTKYEASGSPSGTVTPLENEEAKIREDASRAYGAFLRGANTVNQALEVPSREVAAALQKNPALAAVFGPAAPFVNTKVGRQIVAGAVDPRNLPFMLIGQPEVGEAVRAAAEAGLAGIQGYGAVKQARAGNYGNATIDALMAGAGGAGLYDRIAPEAAPEVPATPNLAATPTEQATVANVPRDKALALAKGLEDAGYHTKTLHSHAPWGDSSYVYVRSPEAGPFKMQYDIDPNLGNFRVSDHDKTNPLMMEGTLGFYPPSREVGKMVADAKAQLAARQQQIEAARAAQVAADAQASAEAQRVAALTPEEAKSEKLAAQEATERRFLAKYVGTKGKPNAVKAARIAAFEAKWGKPFAIAPEAMSENPSMPDRVSQQPEFQPSLAIGEAKTTGARNDVITDTTAAQPPQRPGPGARTIGNTGEGADQSPLAGLASAIEGNAPGAPPEATATAPQAGRIAGALHSLHEALKAANPYKKYPSQAGFQGAVDRFSGANERVKLATAQFRKSILSAVPDKLARIGITNWIQAGGDDALLLDRLAKAPDRYKPGYQAALDLTPDQKTIAQNISNHFEQMKDRGQKEGFLHGAIENYVNQAWSKAPANSGARIRQMFTGKLDTRFPFAAKRVFGSYAEGERAGWTPQTKDIGDLVPMYDRSFERASASRKLVKFLAENKAEDGRPLAAKLGGRTYLPEPGEENGETLPVLANPDVRPGNTEDYIALDHPALKGWSYVAPGKDGAPVLVKSDLALHPDIEEKMKNILQRSWFDRSNSPLARAGKKALNLSSAAKGMMFFGSPFHMVNEGSLAESERVNFWNPPAVDANDALTSELLDHSLTLGSEREGLSSGNLAQKVPAIGPAAQRYEDWLFGPDGYISRLKVATAKALVGRNTRMYGNKLDRDQILKLSATQANNAFGGQNLTSMMRNKTVQDLLRMTTLAPDFLESRLRYNLGALGRYGGATRRAIAFQAAQLYGAARILNTAINGNARLDLPFAVQVGNKRYDLRTNAGDAVHMFTDPRSFAYYRLNPVITRAGITALTGRDAFGRKVSLPRQALNEATQAVPIGLQGPLGIGRDQSLSESLGTSLGVHDRIYRSPAAEIAHQEMLDTLPPTALVHHSNVAKAMWLYRAGKIGDVQKLRESGELTPAQNARALKLSRETPFISDVKELRVEPMLKVWSAATPEERRVMQPILLRKASREAANMTPEDAAALRNAVHSAIVSSPRSSASTALRAIF